MALRTCNARSKKCPRPWRQRQLRRAASGRRRRRASTRSDVDHFSTEPTGFSPPGTTHRGFETVTYMLDGHRGTDHLGHTGDLKSGGVQWTTADAGSSIRNAATGRGPDARIQLWINLPAREKMKLPGIDIRPEEIPVVMPGGARSR
jgi:redox-sensitive bicupin YhaK (pirin superfamily)